MEATRGDFVTLAKSHDVSCPTVPPQDIILKTISPLGCGKLDFAVVKRLVEELEEEKAAAA